MNTAKIEPSWTSRLFFVGGVLAAFASVGCDAPEDTDVALRKGPDTVELIEFVDGESTIIAENNNIFTQDLFWAVDRCADVEMSWAETESVTWVDGFSSGCSEISRFGLSVPPTPETFEDLGLTPPPNLVPTDTVVLFIHASNNEHCAPPHEGSTYWNASVFRRPAGAATNYSEQWNGDELSLTLTGCQQG